MNKPPGLRHPWSRRHFGLTITQWKGTVTPLHNSTWPNFLKFSNTNTLVLLIELCAPLKKTTSETTYFELLVLVFHFFWVSKEQSGKQWRSAILKVGPTSRVYYHNQVCSGTTSPGHTTRALPVSTSGLEPRTSWFRDMRVNHCATKADAILTKHKFLLAKRLGLVVSAQHKASQFDDQSQRLLPLALRAKADPCDSDQRQSSAISVELKAGLNCFWLSATGFGKFRACLDFF